MGHMTPHAVLLGLMGEDPETVEVGRLGRVLDEVRAVGQIDLGLDGGDHKRVKFSLDKDLTWHLNPLPAHPNGMIFTIFDENGDIMATNEYFSVGGGFVVNKETQINENMYYMDVKASDATSARRSQDHGEAPTHSPLAIADGREEAHVPQEKEAPKHDHPPYLFATAEELLSICRENNLTIAQVMWENERAFRTDKEIEDGLLHCAFPPYSS